MNITLQHLTKTFPARGRKAEGETVFEVRVAEGDMGKVIGRQGRIVKEIRVLMKAVAQRKGKKVSVEIMD